MNSLMITGDNKWDIETSHDVFENRDVELIKRISLPLIDRVDLGFVCLMRKGSLRSETVTDGL